VVHALALHEAAEDLLQLVGAIGGNDCVDVAPDHFPRRVSVHPLGACVPREDCSVEILRDDGVFRRLDEGSEDAFGLLLRLKRAAVQRVASLLKSVACGHEDAKTRRKLLSVLRSSVVESFPGIACAPFCFMHPLPAPSLPGLDDVESRRLVLRDGSVASIRPTTAEDAPALADFFARLSPVSRYQRFFSAGSPPEDLVRRLSDSSNPSRTLTLVAERASGIIATASYIALSRDSAEAAFAVSDTFQGRGLATALLSRLAAAAAARGFRRFEAMTLADNERMLEVFRDSGFEIRSKSKAGPST
jgi:RimJ/RimL family protein N-acetyltransferase